MRDEYGPDEFETRRKSDSDVIADLRLSVVELRLSNAHMVDALKHMRETQERASTKAQTDRDNLEKKIDDVTGTVAYGKVGMVVIVSVGAVIAWFITYGKNLVKAFA